MTELINFSGESTTSDISRDIESTAAQARAQAEVQSKLLLAKRFPRSEEGAYMRTVKSLERQTFAESSLYSFPRGGVTVSGPSVNLARELARNWGNIEHGQTIIHDDEEKCTVEGFAWDYETNTYVVSQSSFKKLVQRRKGGTTMWVVPDERDLRELVNKHGAICVRNALLQLFPKDIVDSCVDMAKKTIKSGIDKGDIKLKRVEALKYFDGLGISQEDLESYIGTSTDRWDSEILTQLMGLVNGLKDGSVKKEEIRKSNGSTDAPKKSFEEEIGLPKNPISQIKEDASKG